MRLRAVIPGLFLAGLAVAAGLFLRPGLSERPRSRVSGPAAPKRSTHFETATLVPARPVEVLPKAAASATNTTAARRQAYVDERCAELVDLATEERPEALASILSELTNREPVIRQAAVNAAMQFGSREAIPRLMDVANQTEEEDEKVALLQAVKFLKLPTLSELNEQAKTNALAGKR